MKALTPHGYISLYIRVVGPIYFSVFLYVGVCVYGNGERDDGRSNREETERKSSTSASPFLLLLIFIFYFFLPFCNYHLRKREGDINQDGALQ